MNKCVHLSCARAICFQSISGRFSQFETTCDVWTDEPSYRDSWTHLNKSKLSPSSLPIPQMSDIPPAYNGEETRASLSLTPDPFESDADSCRKAVSADRRSLSDTRGDREVS